MNNNQAIEALESTERRPPWPQNTMITLCAVAEIDGVPQLVCPPGIDPFHVDQMKRAFNEALVSLGYKT